MKKIVLLIAFIIQFSDSSSQNIFADPHWEILWQDHFEYLNSNKWINLNWACHGEPQLYMQDAVSVEAGNLVIKVNNNPKFCPKDPPTVWGACWPCENKTYKYTSGWIETTSAYNVKYGLIEARIKLPYGRGFWPAFWTFVGSGLPSHQNAAEIDIFEMAGHLPSTIITTNLHTNYGNEPNNYQACEIPSYADTYHTYAIAWSPSKIVWYYDGNPIRISNNHGIIDPVRIILNMAIDPTYLPNSTTPFPSEMLVDYVKVYKLKNDCNTDISSRNFNFILYNNKVKRNITIGEKGSSNSVPIGRNIYLRATNSFEIKGSFTIPKGSTFFVEVNPCH